MLSEVTEGTARGRRSNFSKRAPSPPHQKKDKPAPAKTISGPSPAIIPPAAPGGVNRKKLSSASQTSKRWEVISEAIAKGPNEISRITRALKRAAPVRVATTISAIESKTAVAR